MYKVVSRQYYIVSGHAISGFISQHATWGTELLPRPGAGGPCSLTNPLPFPWELKLSEIIITVTRDGVSANISKILMLGFRYYVIASFLKMSQFSASMRYTRRNIAHLAQANAHYFLVQIAKTWFQSNASVGRPAHCSI